MNGNNTIEFVEEMYEGIIKIPDEYVHHLSRRVHVSICEPIQETTDMQHQLKVSKYSPSPIKINQLILPSIDELNKR